MGETTYRLPPLFGLSRVGASVGREVGRGNPDKDVILLQNSEIMLCLANRRTRSAVRKQKQEHNQKFPHAEENLKFFTPNARNPLKSPDSKK